MFRRTLVLVLLLVPLRAVHAQNGSDDAEHSFPKHAPDMSDDDDEDDVNPYRQVDEAWQAQQEANRRARIDMHSEQLRNDEDFFHQDIEDNRFKSGASTSHDRPANPSKVSRKHSIGSQR